MKGINTPGQALDPGRYRGLFHSKLRGILTFRSLHSLGNGTTKLSRSNHSFKNKHLKENPEYYKNLTQKGESKKRVIP